MTTNELIEKLKGLGFTVKESEGYIHIETGNTDMHYSKNISPNDDWAKVLPLIAEYYQTPLDERKPEKKYRLRWLDSDDPKLDHETYLGRDYPDSGGYNWVTCNKDMAEVFTEHELEKLKDENADYAMIIDAMKEEVKDDD